MKTTTRRTREREESPWVHLDGAADILQVSRRTMERMLTDSDEVRRLGAVKVRGQWRFPRQRLATLPPA